MSMDLPEQFSFSKKPIAPPGGKRLSVISATLPSERSQRTSTSSTGSNKSDASSGTANYTTAAASTAATASKNISHRTTARTFSHTDNLIEELPTDNPLLNYDEQIRAPKFAVASKKSLEDIGNISPEFANSQEKPVAPSPSPLDTATELQEQTRKYQPAKVALASETYGASPSPSTSASAAANNNYTLSQYITSMNMISNLETSTTGSTTGTTTAENKSPLSSKKNSEESISLLTSKKVPRFALTPIRPVSDPRTPNYVPCVLRPNTELTATQLDDSLDGLTSPGTEVSRDHWKPNSASAACADCSRIFTLMNRRHHCRKCGEIFCAQCLLSKAKLNYSCNFDVNGVLCKVCFHCGKEWSSYLVESFKVDMMPDFKGNNKESTGPQDQQQLGQEKKGTAVANVPADWSWSSF